MKFKNNKVSLTEADVINNTDVDTSLASRIYSQLSEDVKNELGDFSKLTKTLLTSTSNWEKAMQMTSSVQEEDLLARLFLELSKNYLTIVNNASQIKNCEDVIVKLIKELGFNYYENPVLAFLGNFLKSNGQDIALDRNDAILLNNANSEGIVSDNDMIGTGTDGKNHILYNREFWLINNIYDKWNTLKAYEELSNKSFVERLNTDKISEYLGIKTLKADNVKDVRDRIIYQDGKTKIRPYEQIKNAINVGKISKNVGNKTYNTAVRDIYNAFTQADSSARQAALDLLTNANLI